MEEKSEKVTRLKSSTWIECVSKSKPGQKYLFNKATGASQWIKSEPLSENVLAKKSSTPANDRLKRLQTQLQKAKPVNKKSEEKNNTTAIKSQKPKMVTKKTIPTAALPFISPKDRLKILQGKAIKEQLNEIKAKSHGNNTTTESHENKTDVEIPGNASSMSKASIISKTTKKTTGTEEVVKRTSQKRCAAVCVEIKESKVAKKKETPKEENIQKLISKPPRKRVKTIKSVPPSPNVDSTKIVAPKTKRPLSQDQLTQIPEEVEVPNLKFLTETSKSYSPSLKRQKCSANQRLKRFRELLQNENTVCNQISKTIENSLNDNKVDNEPMDWEPTEEPNTIWTGLDSIVLNNNILEEPTDMEVDENLMLVAAEEKLDTKKLEEKWHKKSVYVVLDTNVFIKDLSFIRELISGKILDAPDIILYIPYSVLKELDKLKLRENIKVPVVRAIRYLNNMFGEKNKNVQAQSSLEERDHLIDVDSSDDSILNCCLQVQANIPNVILVSEDVNLQNKAMCSNIKVSSISGLLEKKYHFSIGDAP